MEFMSERTITDNAPLRPLEAIYVNSDVKDLDGSDGFQLTFPRAWASHPSTNKIIGIRRLNYWAPSTMNMSFQVWIFKDNCEEEDQLDIEEEEEDAFDEVSGCYKTEETNEEEELEEIFYEPTLKRWRTNKLGYCFSFEQSDTLHNILDTMDNEFMETEPGSENNVSEWDRVQVSYDPTTLNFTITVYHCTESGGDYVKVPFKLVFDPTDEEHPTEFLKMFNQFTTDEAVEALKEPREDGILTFTNVWNRDDLFFHASFSDSTKQLIGFIRDSWQNPNICYSGSVSSDDFTVRFTQDTTTKVIPRNGTFFIQLTLIYNYRTALVL